MTSLRYRLLVWLLPATFAVAALASAGSLWGAAISLADLLDDQLRYVAEHVGADGGRVTVDRTNEPKRHLSDEHADDVLAEIWQAGRLSFRSGPRLDLPPPGASGLTDVVVGGQTWHTFVLRRGEQLIRVAQAKDARWEALLRVALQLLWPIAALLPVLGVCLWLGIGYGLRPLHQIAAELRQRDAGSWAPIRPHPLPEEVEPLVDALNGMLARLESAFVAQGEFIADASHELRTPAMALSVQVEIARQARSGPELDQALARLQGGVDRVQRLATQLLSLARLAPGARPVERHTVDLAAACKEVIIDQLPAADAKDQTLGLEVGDTGRVQGDPVALQVLIRNLVDNAIRYSPRRAHIDLLVRRWDHGVVLEVRDDGPGIAEDERPRVLDRFYRGRDAGSTGSGLGLAIVKRIADAHGARLTLENVPDGSGLQVTVFFADSQNPLLG